jgi:hypothetical protein
MERFAKTPFMSRLLEDVTRQHQDVFEQVLVQLGITQENVYLCEIRRHYRDPSGWTGWLDEIWLQGKPVGSIVTEFGDGICRTSFKKAEAGNVSDRASVEVSESSGDDSPSTEGMAWRIKQRQTEGS